MTELICMIIVYYIICKICGKKGDSNPSDIETYKDIRKSGFNLSDDDEENYILYLRTLGILDDKKEKK